VVLPESSSRNGSGPVPIASKRSLDSLIVPRLKIAVSKAAGFPVVRLVQIAVPRALDFPAQNGTLISVQRVIVERKGLVLLADPIEQSRKEDARHSGLVVKVKIAGVVDLTGKAVLNGTSAEQNSPGAKRPVMCGKDEGSSVTVLGASNLTVGASRRGLTTLKPVNDSRDRMGKANLLNENSRAARIDVLSAHSKVLGKALAVGRSSRREDGTAAQGLHPTVKDPAVTSAGQEMCADVADTVSSFFRLF
jgi:hypothetical protein